jgi:hypothetical protein
VRTDLRQSEDVRSKLTKLNGEQSLRIQRLEADVKRAEQTADRLQRDASFPKQVNLEGTVWIAFDLPRGGEVGAVKDGDGDYAAAGIMPGYAELIAAPLNRRCYVTCRVGRMELVRLPAPPTGRLIIDDNIPF